MSNIYTFEKFRSFGQDISETIKYVATFWNAVNLKFSKLANPKIKILITGIIIAKVLIFFYLQSKLQIKTSWSIQILNCWIVVIAGR